MPRPREVAAELPETACRYLKQAHDTLHAPDAAVVMAAACVDAMLKDRGYTEGSLYSRIDRAVIEHVLTEDMGKWAHAVRLEANRTRHADSEEPHASAEQAVQAVEFAEALGEFVYVLSARVRTGLTKAESKPAAQGTGKLSGS
jgi:hypothetical protein